MNFTGVVGLGIIDNTMDGGAEGGISLVGDGLDEVLVEGNRITEKGSYGINLNTYGAPQNGKITIRENTILDTRAANGGAGMAITTAANSFSEPLTIEYNRIVDSAKIGLRNRETTEVDARRNWWGCNLGPGTKGCDSVVAEGEGVLPDFAPWLTLSLSLHDATSFTPSGETISGPVEAGGSATLFARDANLSSGGLADGPFFREAPVTFASDPAGATLNPVTTTLSNNDVTATSAFTANLRPIEWSVTLDHQIVRLFNPDSPVDPGSRPPGLIRPLCRPDRCAVRPHADPAPTGGDHHRAGQPLHPDRPPVAGLHAHVGEAQPHRQALQTDRQLAARAYRGSAVGGAREARRLPRPAREPSPAAGRRTATAGAPRRDEADRPPLWPAAGGDGLIDEGRSPVTHIGPLSC